MFLPTVPRRKEEQPALPSAGAIGNFPSLVILVEDSPQTQPGRTACETDLGLILLEPFPFTTLPMGVELSPTSAGYTPTPVPTFPTRYPLTPGGQPARHVA